MWRKLLRMVLIPAIERAEPMIAEWIDSERERIIKLLNEADSKTIAGQICDKVRESI